MMEQILLSAQNEFEELDAYLKHAHANRIFLVCEDVIRMMQIGQYFDELEARMGIGVVRFTDFSPNPLYDSVVAGVKLFHETGCDFIAAVGGGSAMDVAKCIKLYSNMNDHENYLSQKVVPNQIPFLAMPTTAGTGSEATRYAVIYYNGEKQSISDDSCIPGAVLMDPRVLETLPLYQKKATMMDAFCHAVESFWSVNSTEESKELSRRAIGMIMKNKEAYLSNEKAGNANMLDAAHLAGKAINITQTTAGHAMCYKLTSLYHIAHGHAAALCDARLWPYMKAHPELCIDPRGEGYLLQILDEIADAMGFRTVEEAIAEFQEMVDTLFPQKLDVQNSDYDILKMSVNPVRLKNHPMKLDESSIDYLYHRILG